MQWLFSSFLFPFWRNKNWRCQKCVNIWISLIFYGFFFIMNNYFCIFSQFLIVVFWPLNKIQARVHTNTVIDLDPLFLSTF
jgi:hypothetical protein